MLERKRRKKCSAWFVRDLKKLLVWVNGRITLGEKLSLFFYVIALEPQDNRHVAVLGRNPDHEGENNGL